MSRVTVSGIMASLLVLIAAFQVAGSCVDRCWEATELHVHRGGILFDSFGVQFDPFRAVVAKGTWGQQGAEVVDDGELYTRFFCDDTSTVCPNPIAWNSYEGSVYMCDTEGESFTGRGYCEGC